MSSSAETVPLARLDGVGLSLGGRVIVAGLDLCLWPGKLTVLVGRSGAGKTTTLRLLLGLERPSQGRVEVLGESPRRLHRHRGAVAAALDPPGLPNSATAADAVRLAGRIAGRTVSRTEAERVLERLGLAALGRRVVRRLSQGERQRLTLARALVVAPRLLVLDEPLTHLDPASAWQVMDVLGEERSRGTAVLCSSHHLAHLDGRADHVAFVKDGRIVQQGEVGELLHAGEHWVSVAAADPRALGSALAALPQVLEVRAQDAASFLVRLPTADPASLNASLHERGVSVSRLALHRPSLEQVFRRIEGAEERR